jgi:hypothetical protein
VFVHKPGADAPPPAMLDGRPVRRISAYLMEGDLDGSPAVLRKNRKRAFEGSKLYGNGFAFRDDRPASDNHTLSAMRTILSLEPNSADRIKPLLGGEDLNNDPHHRASRYAMNFSGLTEADVRDRYPALYRLCQDSVKRERSKVANRATREKWWLYERERLDLYAMITPLSQVLVLCRVSPHLAFARVEARQIFGESVDVFTLSSHAAFATLQSRVHEVWARFFASSMKDDLRYTPSDCFETFPLPSGHDDAPVLEAAGCAYHDHRAALMIARDQGMTPTYNRFHRATDMAEDIERLRALHHAMDRAVLSAYGWDDLAEAAAPVFLDAESEDDHRYQGRLFWPAPFRDAVLARLLKLNEDRARMERML